MRDSSQTLYRTRLLQVEQYIGRNLDREMDAAELARVACFSPFHFHRIFMAMKGVGIADYVRRLRLERAAHALLTSDRSVADIAEEAQYKNHESFTRAFGRRYGMPPSDWRLSDGRATEPEAQQPCAARAEYPADVIERPAEIIHALRHVGPYWTVGGTWQQLFDCLERAGADAATCRFYGLPYDDPALVAAQDSRYDACVSFDAAAFAPPADCGFERLEIPAGEFLRVRFSGFIQQIARAYAWLFGHALPRSGRLPADLPVLEHYTAGKVDPMQPTRVELLVMLEAAEEKTYNSKSGESE